MSENVSIRAAQTLDNGMTVTFSELRVKIRVATEDLLGIEAIVRLTGLDAQKKVMPPYLSVWASRSEEVIRALLNEILPYMRIRRNLAIEVQSFLMATTPEAMLNAMVRVDLAQQDLQRRLDPNFDENSVKRVGDADDDDE